MPDVIYAYLHHSLFEPTGPDSDKTSRLRATLILGEYRMHLEAIEVKTNQYGTQSAANSLFDSNLEGAYIAGEPDKPFSTVEIGDKSYVLIATPYC